MVGSSSYQQESLESTILAVVHATRKLPHHFQEYTVIVITQPPLRATLQGTDYAERVAKWGTVLEASDVKYMPRTLVKGLVLAGLVAQFAEFPLEKEAEGQSMDGEAVKQNLSYVGSSDLLLWRNQHALKSSEAVK